jgi:RNA polymerase sigma factor (TIGR02999 family)
MSPRGEIGQARVSQLLSRWADGDKDALKSLIPFVYKELRQLAHKQLRRECHRQTLQTTLVVHEAYLRLAKHSPRSLRDRKQFFAMAAGIMRQVLVDHAREKQALKRDSGLKVELTPELTPVVARELDMLALEQALEGLAKLDPRQSRIVELRFFAGLSIEEAAEILGISRATVKRDWLTARAWLQRQLLDEDEGQAGAGAESAV